MPMKCKFSGMNGRLFMIFLSKKTVFGIFFLTCRQNVFTIPLHSSGTAAREHSEPHMKKDTKTDGLIILAFALVHAAVAYAFGRFGFSDELMLTLLTMAMTVVLCLRRSLNIEITAACVIIVNVAGFLVGTEGGVLLGKVLRDPVAVSSLVTFLTTVILGWSTAALTKAFQHGGRRGSGKAGISGTQIRVLIFAFTFIFLLRLLIFVFSSSGRNPWSTLEILSMILSNSAAIITIICVNIIFVRFSRRIAEGVGKKCYWFIFTLFLLITSQMVAYIVCLSPGSLIHPDTSADFIQLCVLCLVTDISAYCIIYLANHSIEVQQAMRVEKEKRHYAQFRYEKLKQQVNPHFLFNSLNVLDSLVAEGRNPEASEFIHKLAGLYRYMIRNEEERLVTLRDEMEFVEAFTDLMKTRFPKGFEMEIDISGEDADKFVPPCAVQMLVENAFKHNAVSVTRPLKIALRSVPEGLEVRNGRIPRASAAESTGVGLKYIRQQYADLGGGEVVIEETEGEYAVRLPLLSAKEPAGGE